MARTTCSGLIPPSRRVSSPTSHFTPCLPRADSVATSTFACSKMDMAAIGRSCVSVIGFRPRSMDGKHRGFTCRPGARRSRFIICVNLARFTFCSRANAAWSVTPPTTPSASEQLSRLPRRPSSRHIVGQLASRTVAILSPARTVERPFGLPFA